MDGKAAETALGIEREAVAVVDPAHGGGAAKGQGLADAAAVHERAEGQDGVVVAVGCGRQRAARQQRAAAVEVDDGIGRARAAGGISGAGHRLHAIGEEAGEIGIEAVRSAREGRAQARGAAGLELRGGEAGAAGTDGLSRSLHVPIGVGDGAAAIITDQPADLVQEAARLFRYHPGGIDVAYRTTISIADQSAGDAVIAARHRSGSVSVVHGSIVVVPEKAADNAVEAVGGGHRPCGVNVAHSAIVIVADQAAGDTI